MEAWRGADESEHFDHRAIRARLDRLRALSAAGDAKGQLFVLNEGIHGNIEGLGNERLDPQARLGTTRRNEAYGTARTTGVEGKSGEESGVLGGWRSIKK